MLAAAAVLVSLAPAASHGQAIVRHLDDGTIYVTNIEALPGPHGDDDRVASVPQPPAASRPAGLRETIAEAARQYALPPSLIEAVIAVESGFNSRAVSPKGAQGLMQLMPQTAAMLGVRDPFDPVANVHGGVRHLRGLVNRFWNNLPLALAAYNAGAAAVARHGGIPPYRETRDYVARIVSRLGGVLPAVAETLADEPAGTGASAPSVADPEWYSRTTRADGTIVYSNRAGER
jgi:hypothetical protein